MIFRLPPLPGHTSRSSIFISIVILFIFVYTIHAYKIWFGNAIFGPTDIGWWMVSKAYFATLKYCHSNQVPRPLKAHVYANTATSNYYFCILIVGLKLHGKYENTWKYNTINKVKAGVRLENSWWYSRGHCHMFYLPMEMKREGWATYCCAFQYFTYTYCFRIYDGGGRMNNFLLVYCVLGVFPLRYIMLFSRHVPK